MPLLRFLEPTLHTLVSAAVFRRISLLASLADSPTEFRADRGSLTDPAPAPRGAGVSFFAVPCGPGALSTAAIAGVLNRESLRQTPVFQYWLLSEPLRLSLARPSMVLNSNSQDGS